jgi:molecular chaperone GrpE
MTKKEKNNKKEKIEEEVKKIPVEAAEEHQETASAWEEAMSENGEQPEDGEQPEGYKQAETQLEALQKQLEEAEAKAAENLDGWQRAQAEFINYKNRVQRDREMDYATMKGDIIKKMLPVLDDMERALANRPEGDSWANGMELIARKFHGVLEAEGIKKIEAEGQEFDPNFHEAISSEPNDEVESGHVIAVMQNGYMLGERVIRPAMVRVAQ